MSKEIFDIIEGLVNSNANGIADDFESLKNLLINLELDKTKEKQICFSIPITFSFEWHEGDEGVCHINDYEDKLEAINTIKNGFETEMNNRIIQFCDECDKYADKHNIDHQSFSYYFFYNV